MFLLDCKKKEIRHKKATKFRRIQLALSIPKSWKKQILSIANIQKAFHMTSSPYYNALDKHFK